MRRLISPRRFRCARHRKHRLNPGTRRGQNGSRPLIEMLEDRSLLSGVDPSASTLVITVNTTADDDTRDSTLSLREAIEISNGTLPLTALSTQERAQVTTGTSPTNVIDFDIPGSGVQEIVVGSDELGPLPVITTPVVIDGYSQPGATVNTLAAGDNARLLIELNGADAGNQADGLVIDGGGSTVRGLVINGFQGTLSGNTFTGGAAIFLSGASEDSLSGAGGDSITGNFIGTDATGNTVVANSFDGVVVEGVANNSIGGTDAADRNLISGNALGVSIHSGATGNVVEGNLIGTNAAGNTALNSNGAGVGIVDASNNTIGGTAAGSGNVISGNGVGVFIGEDTSTATNNLVEGNYIGIDATGNNALANMAGVGIAGENNTVGGTTAAARNVISGNLVAGVVITPVNSDATGNTVLGNFVGTNAAGTAAVPNGGGDYDTIASQFNQIVEELTGVSPGLTGPALQALAGGVSVVGAGDNTVSGNTIANNLGNGVHIDTGTGNLISQNLIYSNQGLGIDLVSNGNNDQPAPVLTSVSSSGGTTTIQGNATGAANAAYTLEFFSNLPGDSAQGRTYIGSYQLTTNGGPTSFTVSLPVTLSSGQFVTATATDPSHNTSEFGTLTQPLPPGNALFLEGQAGDGSDATFVHNLYRNLLGREPDAAGQAFWISYLNHNGGLTASTPARRIEVVQAFLDSAEYTQHLVGGIYENLLHRTADAEGLQFWSDKMFEPGMPGGATGSGDEMFVIAAITASQEYYLLQGGTVQAWIDGLYQDLLGRTADQPGAQYWQQRATLVDRDELVRELLRTPEAEHKLLNAFYPAADPSIPPPGAPAGGPYALANLVGGGWENLYFQGNFVSPTPEDVFFHELQEGVPWDIVIEQMLEAAQYYTATEPGL